MTPPARMPRRLIVPGDIKMGRSVSALASIEVFAVPKVP